MRADQNLNPTEKNYFPLNAVIITAKMRGGYDWLAQQRFFNFPPSEIKIKEETAMRLAYMGK